MKLSLIILLVVAIGASSGFAQEKKADSSLDQARKKAMGKQPEHLLDGTSFKYYYTNGGGTQIEFYNGMMKYEWIIGSTVGNKNKI